MKRKVCFGLLFAFVTAMVVAQPLQATNNGAISITEKGGLKLDPSGAVSVTAGQTLTLTITVTNHSSNSITCASLQAVVINPWTGTRILGPTSFPVPPAQQTLAGETTICDEYGNCTTTPGGSTNVTVTLTIPRTVPGTYTSTVNMTLGAIIYALDPNSTVRSVTGWSFFATQ
jgi:hypothetical protein